MAREFDVLNQRVDELDGSRRAGAIGKAAVRLDDLNGLLRMADTLQSAKAAGSTPTKAEFDLLVEDVQMLHTRLMAIVAAVRGRRGRT